MLNELCGACARRLAWYVLLTKAVFSLLLMNPRVQLLFIIRLLSVSPKLCVFGPARGPVASLNRQTGLKRIKEEHVPAPCPLRYESLWKQ